MHYVEDFLELVDGQPEAVDRCYDHLHRLDLECTKKQARVLALTEQLKDKTNTDKAVKLKLCSEVGETYLQLKQLTRQKIEAAERAENIIRTLADKVIKDEMQFKWDLEAENPGCTESIERNFVNYLLTEPFRRKQPPGPSQMDPSLFSDPIDRFAPYSPRPFGQRNQMVSSSAGRKAAKKQGTSRGRGRPTKYDEFSFDGVKEEDTDSRASSIKEDDSLSNLLDDDLNDLHDIFPQMPSPPREILDIMKDDAFGYEELGMMPLSPAASVSAPKNYGDRRSREGSTSSYTSAQRKSFIANDVSMHGRPRKLTSRVEEMLNDKREKDRRRHHSRDEEHSIRSMMDGRNQSETAGDDDEEEEEEEEEEDEESIWCVCKKPSDGDMIYCENEDCRIQWFHFECVGLSQAPIGHWFCPECSHARANNAY
ncbi:unnamed protein product, partial [Mesorhabditis spiculigera]